MLQKYSFCVKNRNRGNKQQVQIPYYLHVDDFVMNDMDNLGNFSSTKYANHMGKSSNITANDNIARNTTKTISKDDVWIWIGNFQINSEKVAIAILFSGLLCLIALILHSWRKDVVKRRNRKIYRLTQQDLPPTYEELTSRKKPPDYKESLMQV